MVPLAAASECRPIAACHSFQSRRSPAPAHRHAHPCSSVSGSSIVCASHRGSFVGASSSSSSGASSSRRTSGSSSRLASADVKAEAGVTAALPDLLPLDGDYEAKHEFSTFANWLVPGRLLLGRYPFCEPGRCPTRDQGERQLQAIVNEGGVTTFVSLQAEVPPQEVIPIGGHNGFLPYKATAQLVAAAASGPPPMQSIHELRTPDLDKFLPPRRRRVGEPQLAPGADASEGHTRYSRKELEFLRFPVVDLGLPTEEQVLELVSQLGARLSDPSKVVYLHCWAGRGRAGTVGACLLGAAYGLPAEEAMLRVQRAFDTRNDGGRPSPETAAQQQFVRDFLAKHGGR